MSVLTQVQAEKIHRESLEVLDTFHVKCIVIISVLFREFAANQAQSFQTLHILC
jgi:hypothetical protein